MSGDPVEQWLKETIGLSPGSLGTAMVSRAIARGQIEAGASCRDEYALRLRSEPALARALVSELLINETWFFRDRTPFELVRTLAPRLRAAAGTRPLRLLSLPCATGEEPCSLAIACFEAGLDASEFRIEACDLSHDALLRAREGVYGVHSFRGVDLATRDRWFRPTNAINGRAPRMWRVAPEVLATIDYMEGNALTFDFDRHAGGYDIIFCRNLLIYLEAETQRRLLRRLRAALSTEGFLCVGHAEAALAIEVGLEPLPLERSFAFARPKAKPVPARPARGVTAATPSPARRPLPPLPPRMSAPQVTPVIAMPAPAPAVVTNAVPDLEEGMRLADRGRLDEAVAIAEKRLQLVGPEAGSYYLLGLARDAGGDADAAEAAYRKALYLEPHHADALNLLAALLDQRGDTAGARRLRMRARESVIDNGGLA